MNATAHLLVAQLSEAPRMPISNAKSFCVYALYRGDVVVYVGSSTWVSSRVLQHVSAGKDFDSYAFVNVNSIEEMHELEVRSIVQFDPEYNLGLAGTTKSGFTGMAGLKVRYGLGAVAIRRTVQKAKTEVLHFRGCAYYNVKEADEAMQVNA